MTCPPGLFADPIFLVLTVVLIVSLMVFSYCMGRLDQSTKVWMDLK